MIIQFKVPDEAREIVASVRSEFGRITAWRWIFMRRSTLEIKINNLIGKLMEVSIVPEEAWQQGGSSIQPYHDAGALLMEIAKWCYEHGQLCGVVGYYPNAPDFD